MGMVVIASAIVKSWAHRDSRFSLLALLGLLLFGLPMLVDDTIGADEAIASSITSRITRRWGEHSTAQFKLVSRDALLVGGSNENGSYLGIRDSDEKHTVLFFDLSAVPSGTQVYQAKLRLFWEVVYGAADQGLSGFEMNLYRITDPDQLGMWIEDQVTVTERRTGVPWTAGGGIFSSISAKPIDHVFSNPKAYGLGAENCWMEWDVTEAVRDWVANRFPNQGFLLDGRQTLGLDAIACSREHLIETTRPYLEVTYAGAGSYPEPVSGVQAQYTNGQTFITWNEAADGDSETAYRIYRHTVPLTIASLDEAELIDEAPQGSAIFDRLNENNHRLSTPFSQEPLAQGIGLYVYTVETSGTHYYGITRLVRGNENRGVGSDDTTGPIEETVQAASPVLQYREDPSPLASANRHVFLVWLGRFDPLGVYTNFGYANRRSVPYLFRVITPEYWNPAQSYPMLVVFHYFSDSYVGSGQNMAQPRFVLTGDDFDPAITANLYGASMWYGYNSNYGTKRSPTEGVAVNYTERRMDWILDWVIHRSQVFRVDTNRIYMKGGSMGGAAQWHYGIRRSSLFAAGESTVPGINLTVDPDQRHYPLWGYESTIRTSEGIPLDQQLDASYFIRTRPACDLPILLSFVRKGDEAIPWRQMPPWLQAMESSRHLGGILYWTQGDHTSGEHPAEIFPEWSSVEEYDDWIYQYVHNQSYPAFSNCSLNEEPGTTDPLAGDPRGGLNRFVRWDTTDITDTPAGWAITARLHLAAPADTATSDVTPRRLQAFAPVPATYYPWENRLILSQTIIQSGLVAADSDGLLALTNIVLTKAGNRIAIGKLQPDAIVDSDHDGQSDAFEIRAGTNPYDPKSVFKLLGITIHADATRTLTWSSVPGKRYEVQFSDKAQIIEWNPLVGAVIGAGETCSVSDHQVQAGPIRLYRVRLLE